MNINSLNTVLVCATRNIFWLQVLTVEPGCYFIPHCIEEAFSESSKVRRFLKIGREACLRLAKTVGGVRIEDDIVITEEGCRVLNNVPREVEDIEGFLQGKFEWDLSEMCQREYRADVE